MNKHIENAKNWMKKHKRAVILTTGGVAAGIGVLVFRNEYYVVPNKSDYFTVAKDSVEITDIPEDVRKIGEVISAWESSEHTCVEIANVALPKLGEVGKAFSDGFKDDHVGILVYYDK